MTVMAPRAHAPGAAKAYAPLLAAYLAFAVAADGRGLPRACLFHAVTGVRCPLCGLTTATGRLLRGDLRGSLAAHPLAVIAVPAASLWVGGGLVRNRLAPT